mmetsp:Transcript_79737/g.200636  ORF Transcript_79737/g.200636 Transcript_79737/m.200636 type:complete len:240 (+) Transcript_79737:498-1217(+)
MVACSDSLFRAKAFTPFGEDSLATSSDKRDVCLLVIPPLLAISCVASMAHKAFDHMSFALVFGDHGDLGEPGASSAGRVFQVRVGSFGRTPLFLKSAKRFCLSSSMICASTGKRDNVRISPSRWMTRQSQKFFAFTVALLRAATGSLQMAAISPKTEPAPRVATETSPATISTSPLLSTYMLSPKSPCCKMMSPQAKTLLTTCSANISRNSLVHSLKRGTARKQSMWSTPCRNIVLLAL